MTIFGINFNLFYLLLMKDFANIFKNEELRYYLGIIGIATLLITANIATMYDSIEQAFRNAFFQVTALAISSCTSGRKCCHYTVKKRHTPSN